MSDAGDLGRRSIGVDLGAVRCGIAVDDELGALAHARPNLEARDLGKLVVALVAVAAEVGARRFVVGLPLHMDGRSSAGSARVRRFAEQLAEASGRDVVLWDERLSTVEAARALQASGINARDAKSRIDGAAATVILQGFLDRQRLRRSLRRASKKATP